MNIKIIRNLSKAELTGEPVGFDTETLPGESHEVKDNIATMQIYQESNDTCYVIPIRTVEHQETEEDKEVTAQLLKSLKVIGHWLQFDLTKVLAHYGTLPTPTGDLFLVACMLQWDNLGLDDITRVFLPEETVRPISTVIDVEKLDWSMKNKHHLDYMASDAKRVYKIHKMLEEKGTLKKLKKAYHIDLRALPVYVKSRVNGMYVDMDKYEVLMDTVSREVETLTEQFQKEAGHPTKPGSPKALQELLFNTLGLPETPVRTPKGAPSTNAQALEYLRGQHPCVETLIECKHKIAVHSGSKKLPEFLQEDGRLHPEFRQIGIDGTSRVYTSKPSVNQYPLELRESIIAPPGRKFVFFDWSAAELILAAYWSKCTELLEQYEEGDLHSYVASKVLGRDNITKEEREKIKVTVFSSLFGSEGAASARTLMIPLSEAQGYVQEFFTQFAPIAKLKESIEARCARTGYTYTIYGRPRQLKKVFSNRSQEKAQALRQSFNTAIQGSVADLLKVATARTAKYPQVDFVIGVFDSMLLSVPEDMKEEEYLPIIEELSTFGDLKMKFKVAEGPNWRYVQDRV